MITLFTIFILIHGWYPPECCGDQDCHEVPCVEVKPADKGYFYQDTFFHMSRVRPSPDGKCHACAYWMRKPLPRCLFIPQTNS